ncbi:MAG TPA: DUF2812 domain-containing protein [Candidatus Merdivicinus intestinavium]|nr:DUF2812 domain-containing protein [Candidatus Merdivicinus intestinavium]
MKQRERWRWLPYRVTEPGQLARYFEEQAALGWLPVRVGRYAARFRKKSPRRLRFCVDFAAFLPDSDQMAEYRALCADAGWRYRLRARDGWLLFQSRDPEAVPLQTDPALEAKSFRSFYWGVFWNRLNLALIACLFPLMNLGIADNLRFVTGWNTMAEFFLAFLLLLFLLFSLGSAAAGLGGYFRCRKAMKAGNAPPEAPPSAAARRIRVRKIFLWTGGIALAGALGYDIWAGNIRPEWENIAAVCLGAAMLLAGWLWVSDRWGEGLLRKFLLWAGALFAAVGVFLSYPLYRMESAVFTAEDPVVLAARLLPEGQINASSCEYGHTPLYERWEVDQSASVPVSENVYDGITVHYEAWRAASPAIARRILREETESYQSIFHEMPITPLDWPVEEAVQIGTVEIILRDGGNVAALFLGGDDPEQYRAVMLEAMEKLAR